MTTTQTTNVRRRIGGALTFRNAEGGQPSRRIEGDALLFGVESAPFEDSSACRVVEVIEPSAVTTELLDSCDIKMTFDHDVRRLLARSVNGEGSLSYSVDEAGVHFAFDAPATADGDMVLELVRRGDLRGCSFCFSTDYSDPECVAVERSHDSDGRELVTIRHRRFNAVYDFAITPDPAYPATTVEARGLPESVTALLDQLKPQPHQEPQPRAWRPRRKHIYTI